MKENIWLYINAYILPFVIGAAWEFCPVWISTPAIVLMFIQWVDAYATILNDKKEKNT